MRRIKRKIRFKNILKHLVWKLKIVKFDECSYVYVDVRNWLKILYIPILLIVGGNRKDISELLEFDESHAYVFSNHSPKT